MKFQYLLPLLAVIACGSGKDDGGKMPWGGDLDGKDDKPAAAGYEVGEVLPAWEKGCLDIHAINSGRGECYLYILPDGTTMLVDAGEVTASGAESIPRKPNEATRPYVTYSRYIKHFLPEGKSKLDYMYLTHFHIDHMGEDNSAYPKNAAGYRTVGVSGVFEEVGFTTLLDRGYPSYGDDNTILAPESTATNNYIAFVKYATAQKGLKAERIEVGSDSQVRLLTDPSYDCKLLNIIGNGQYVTTDGDGRKVAQQAIDGENPASCGFHLRYGKFDCIACGDLTSAPQNRMAYYYRDFVGVLEVFKANHHLSANSWGSQMQKCSFSPRVILNESFSNYQPDMDLFRSIQTGVFAGNTYTWTKDVFLTNLHADLSGADPELFALAHANGHIVVRVAPGGDSFSVYMLDDSDFGYRIKSIHGPFNCR
jgi:hypothetical protein